MSAWYSVFHDVLLEFEASLFLQEICFGVPLSKIYLQIYPPVPAFMFNATIDAM